MSTQNPLVDDTIPGQTLSNLSSVISYLSMVTPVKGCELGDHTQHGLYLLLLCVQEALDFEADRVGTLRKATKEA